MDLPERDLFSSMLLHWMAKLPYMQLSIIELRNVRKVQIPWQSSPAPSWLKADYEISYEGQDQLAIPGTPSGTLPVSVQMQVTSIENKAVEARLIKYLQGAFNSASSRGVLCIHFLSCWSTLVLKPLCVLTKGYIPK